MTGILSVSEAREQLLARLHSTNPVSVRLRNALGRVNVEPVISPVNIPPFANSSMDGFAVKAADTQRAGPTQPIVLPVVADIPAGTFSGPALFPGQSARIMTGAPLPDGADAVIPIEDTDQAARINTSQLPDTVQILRPARSGEYVRPAGQDIRTGQTVLEAGHLLRPADIGLLAALGVTRLKVHRQPRVALLASGDELLEADQPLVPGKIRDANSYTLAALIAQLGGKIIPLGIASDNEESVRNRLDEAVSSRADLIVSSAGVSVGAFDFVREVILSRGEIDFWRVNLRPGKPLAFGNYQGIPFIGLPGNPASAFVGFEIFVRPAFLKLAGAANTQRIPVPVRSLDPIESDGRESYLRVVVFRQATELIARLTGHQGSGNLFSIAQANALLIVPSGVKSLPAGSILEAWLLDV